MRDWLVNDPSADEFEAQRWLVDVEFRTGYLGR